MHFRRNRGTVTLFQRYARRLQINKSESVRRRRRTKKQGTVIQRQSLEINDLSLSVWLSRNTTSLSPRFYMNNNLEKKTSIICKNATQGHTLIECSITHTHNDVAALLAGFAKSLAECAESLFNASKMFFDSCHTLHSHQNQVSVLTHDVQHNHKERSNSIQLRDALKIMRKIGTTIVCINCNI